MTNVVSYFPKLLLLLTVVHSTDLVAGPGDMPTPTPFPSGTYAGVPGGVLRIGSLESGPLWIDVSRCRLEPWLEQPDIGSTRFAPIFFHAGGFWWGRRRNFLLPNPGFEFQVGKRTMTLSLVPELWLPSPRYIYPPFAAYLPEVGTATGSPGVGPTIISPFTAEPVWIKEDLLHVLEPVPGACEVVPL